MADRPDQALSIRFDVYQMDLSSGELRKSGKLVRLQRQPFRVLGMLAGRAGELVTRAQLRDEIWGKGTFVDFDQGLNFCIRQIRSALDEDPSQPRFVQTIPRRGYRFVAKAVQTGDASGRRAIGSIAVLPLKNLSGSPDEDYFVEGLTEELITELSKLGNLRVISRTSVMLYKDSEKTLPEIAHELKVDAVVEGAAMRSGEQVRITAQLIEAATDAHLWAESYHRELRDILVLQKEIAYAIARQIQSNLAPRRKSVAETPRVNPSAYLAYQKGRFLWNQRSDASLQKGIQLFHKAIDNDPLYSAAYSGLADCLTALGYASSLSPEETFPQAKAMALRALELDPTLAEPHASLGYAKLYYDWDWKGAESEFREAIALNRNYVTAHHWYSVYLTAMGRELEARSEIEMAQELDPLSLAINTDVGFELYYSGHYDQAIEQLQFVLDLNPGFPLANLWMGRAYQQKRSYDLALDRFKQAADALPEWPVVLAAIGNVLGESGRRREARKILSELGALSRRKYVTSYGMALVYAGLGDKAYAFKWLSEAVEERSHWLVWLKLDPRWNGISSDSRFKTLLKRVGLDA
jgi:TolB-like protein/Tfp pilus assembly protein PilF